MLGYRADLVDLIAACDVAVVQGGLSTCMELTAAARPFLYVPLRHHFEQNFHVRARLERYRAGVCLDYERAGDPDALVAALLRCARDAGDVAAGRDRRRRAGRRAARRPALSRPPLSRPALGRPGHLPGVSAFLISISAVAWIRLSSSASRPGENSSRRSGAMVIGTPSGMIAVLSSVPSLDGEAPR